jgi:drug/metabolite transporter (DMT)-like permease
MEMIVDPLAAILMILLALLPTIGGFLCTTKALTLLSSESVQLMESSEPVFVLMFSFVFLKQTIFFWQIVGGCLLIASIYAHRVAIPHRA